MLILSKTKNCIIVKSLTTAYSPSLTLPNPIPTTYSTVAVRSLTKQEKIPKSKQMRPSKFKRVSFAKEPPKLIHQSYDNDTLEIDSSTDLGLDLDGGTNSIMVPQAPRNSPILSFKNKMNQDQRHLFRQRNGPHYSLKKEVTSDWGVRKARSSREETLTNQEKQYLKSLLLPMPIIVVSHSDNRRSCSAPEMFYSGESLVRNAVLKLNALQDGNEESNSFDCHQDQSQHLANQSLGNQFEANHLQNDQVNHLQNAMKKVHL